MHAAGPLLLLALVLMLLGTLAVLFSMLFLGRRSFGQAVGSLRTDGLYRYSRNPQLVGGFLSVAGYALLWPSWPGAAWVCLWPVIGRITRPSLSIFSGAARPGTNTLASSPPKRAAQTIRS